MKRTLLILAFLWGLPLLAQNQLTVTGTIVDPSGHPYASGTSHFSLVCTGNAQAYSGTYPIPRDVPTVGLDGNGSFSQVLFNTSLLLDVNGNPLVCNYVDRVTERCGIANFSTGPLNGIVGAGPVNLSSQINSFAVPLSTQCAPGNGGTVGPGTTNFIAIFTGPTTIGNGPCAVFAGILVCATPIDVQLFGYGIEKQNSASGTTCGLSVSLDAAGNAITTVNGAINGSIGVASLTQPGIDASGITTNCGTSGNVFIGDLGNFTLTFDNQTTINDYITIGANGRFHDAGATEPTGVQVIGLVTSANTFPGTPNANADIWTGDHVNSNGVRGTACAVNGTVVSGTVCNFNATTPAAPANFQDLTWATDNLAPTSNVSVQVPQATTGQAGIVKLAQDFCGTFALPIVCGIQTIPVTFSNIAARDVLCFVTTISIQNCELGVPVRTVAGNSDTILATDRVTDVRYTAASGATAVTLPQAGTTGFAFNFPTLLTNAQGSGTVTVTPTTSTINGNATLAINAGFYCFIYSDNTNYVANCGQVNGGGAGGGGSTSVFVENVTPDTSGNVLWTVNPFTNFRDGYWDWVFGATFPVSLYAKVRIPHVLPSGTAKVILSQLGANDATASHTMTFKVCTISVTTTLNVAAPTCTATQNFTTTGTAYSPQDLTFTVPTAVSIDTQLDIVITATAESGLVADVQLEGISMQWE